MKLLFSLFLFSSFSAISQTDIIAARSHSNTELSSSEVDNYGLPSRSIDSIIYIGNGCIVERAFMYVNDTLCDHPLFVENNFDLKKLKKLYPSNVVFVGFTKSEKRELDKQNSMSWFAAIIGLSYLLYLLFPRFVSRKN